MCAAQGAEQIYFRRCPKEMRRRGESRRGEVSVRCSPYCIHDAEYGDRRNSSEGGVSGRQRAKEGSGPKRDDFTPSMMR